MPQFAYFDCLSGIAGDMTLGALIDLGVDASMIESGLRSMGLPGLSLSVEPVRKAGFRALHVTIDHPAETAHRHLADIEAMIDEATEIETAAKSLGKKIFGQVAQAEAAVHGHPVEKVHFHEVGAIDSIADIVGTAIALTALEIDRVAASAIPTGTGSIQIAHGRVSIPAPATLEILKGVPIAESLVEAELTTPTGAAILKATCESFGPMPAMVPQRVGYGAGTMDLPGQANVLRIVIGHDCDNPPSLDGVESDRVVILETNIDDCTPEQIADAAERARRAGAIEVFQTPCVMKKGRGGVVLTVIGPASRIAILEHVIFDHTSSIGIRRRFEDRHKLPRRAETIETQYGPVRVKVVATLNGGRRIDVEADEASRIASAHGISCRDVHREVSRAMA